MAITEPPPRRSALVVDDDPAARFLLKSLLSRSGYEVAVAVDGLEAVAQFTARRAGIVFMDMQLPEMDGLEATRRIKTISGSEFVPVIFVSGAGETADLVRSIDAGGDDFLTKPLDERVLGAKLRAFERMRTLHRSSARLHERARDDWEVAQALLGQVVMGPNARSDALHADMTPTDTFSADVYLAAYCPSGDLNVLLGDFTGHGLAAALAAMPTAEIFRSMTAKGFAPQQILQEINRKLKAQLPTGKFLAASFVQVSRSLERIWVANCGMPEVLILGRNGVRQRIRSGALPLGILPELDLADCLRSISIERSERVLLASDGVHEAVNARGEQFGRARFEQAAAYADKRSAADRIKQAFDSFRDGEPIADDASLVEIQLVPALFHAHQAPQCALVDTDGVDGVDGTDGADGADGADGTDGTDGTDVMAGGLGARGQWRMSIDLHADALRLSDPVPMLLSQLQEVPGLGEHRSVLYTVVSELYSNALDHGVLQLSSRLKDLPDGFERFLAARQQQLATLSAGWVRMSVVCTQWRGGGELAIRVQDSGAGFDWRSLPHEPATGAHGRGLHLVQALCRALSFENGGNCACATYGWGSPAQVTDPALSA